MKYVTAYIVGSIIALLLANWLWYPAPDLHGVRLGLLMGGIALSGAAIAMGAVALATRS